MTDEQAITVRCEPDGDDWHCTVMVGVDPGATQHHVTVRAEDFVRLAPGESTVDGLVSASFAFLLEREPREAILRSFDLPAISRYFPEYQREMQRRLGS